MRPDGRITLPLVNDVVAGGLDARAAAGAASAKQAAKFVEEPTVTVVVKQINSRKVFISGMVGRPGAYPLSGPTTVLQMISMAGGLSEFADDKNIIINAHRERTAAAR